MQQQPVHWGTHWKSMIKIIVLNDSPASPGLIRSVCPVSIWPASGLFPKYSQPYLTQGWLSPPRHLWNENIGRNRESFECSSWSLWPRCRSVLVVAVCRGGRSQVESTYTCMHSPPHGSAVNYRPTHISPAVNSTASFWISGGRGVNGGRESRAGAPPFSATDQKIDANRCLHLGVIHIFPF